MLPWGLLRRRLFRTNGALREEGLYVESVCQLSMSAR